MENNNTHCLNCGQHLHGHFCHICGQENIDIKLSFSELVRDFFGDMFTYDSRFYRTIVPLLFRPGFLTLEFFKGRRIPYVPPLRLYLFISFIMFLWLAIVGANSINIESPDQQVREEISKELATALEEEEFSRLDSWIESAEERLKVVRENPRAFTSLVASRLPYLMFLLLPVFALLMWLHFAFSRFNYLQHFVFTLHFHCFAYLINFLFSIADKIIIWSYSGWALLILNVYLAIAMRKTFNSSILGCIFKTFSILMQYLAILVISFIVFLVVNFMNFG